MGKFAVEELNRCVICEKPYNPSDPSSRPPICSDEHCWWLWTKVQDHRGAPCWIAGCLEVFCGTRTQGYCSECDVFKTNEEIKKGGH